VDCISARFPGLIGLSRSTAGKHAKLTRRDCALRRSQLHPPQYFFVTAAVADASGNSMRAEVERLVEEIKQSVGLLRRHL
jgi:hypothetical protein